MFHTTGSPLAAHAAVPRPQAAATQRRASSAPSLTPPMLVQPTLRPGCVSFSTQLAAGARILAPGFKHPSALDVSSFRRWMTVEPHPAMPGCSDTHGLVEIQGPHADPSGGSGT
ncbi:MAG: hypothetical protein WDW36_000381 [Sanguina aurantia]